MYEINAIRSLYKTNYNRKLFYDYELVAILIS